MIDFYQGVRFTTQIPKQDVNEKIKKAIAKISNIFSCKVNVQLHEALEERDCLGIKKNDFFLDFSTSNYYYDENWTEEQAKSAALCVKDIVKQPVEYSIQSFKYWETGFPNGIV